MQAAKLFLPLVWIGTLLAVGLAFFVWWPSTENLTTYSLFPIFGLIAFTLMWTHYTAGALREYLQLPDGILKTHFQVTSYIVLFCILVHPILLETQLYLDGLGLPNQSIPAVYTTITERLAIVAGITALICFLLFELYRFFKDRSWWKYVEWANIVAMGLILWHGFTLGGELRQPWFQLVWAFYAVTFIGAVAYSGYSKRRKNHGRQEHV
jgi:hypothetical protein